MQTIQRCLHAGPKILTCIEEEANSERVTHESYIKLISWVALNVQFILINYKTCINKKVHTLNRFATLTSTLTISNLFCVFDTPYIKHSKLT